MKREKWRVEIVGTVSHVVESGARIAAPRGEYDMVESDLGSYELSRTGGPVFSLTLLELSTEVKARHLKIIEGRWP